MTRRFIITLLFFASCTAPNRILSYTTNTKPLYPVNPSPVKIIVLNMHDVAAQKYRDNKEEVFTSIIDNLLEWQAAAIKEQTGTNAKALKGYTAPGQDPDSTVRAILSREQASHAIVINNFDVYFEQTNVEVTRDPDGSKNREAFYDIVAPVEYTFYTKGEGARNLTVTRRRRHSSRGVISGLLAAGPSIVSRREDALDIVLDNGQRFLDYFFPGKAQRMRPVFSGKGFEPVQACLEKNDYECALTESLRLLKDPNAEKASKAAYNCAVFFERKSQPDEMRKYLEESLSLYPLAEAMRMKNSLQGIE